MPSDAFDEESSSSGASGPRFRIFINSVIYFIVKSGFGPPSESRGLSEMGIQTVPANPASIPPAIVANDSQNMVNSQRTNNHSSRGRL